MIKELFHGGFPQVVTDESGPIPFLICRILEDLGHVHFDPRPWRFSRHVTPGKPLRHHTFHACLRDWLKQIAATTNDSLANLDARRMNVLDSLAGWHAS